MPLVKTYRQAVCDLLYFVGQQANIMNWTSDQQAQLLALIHQRSERAVLDQQLKHTEAELVKQEVVQQQGYAHLLKEEQDVDRLERLSWAKVYYDLLNRREAQLTKEQAEAEAALVRYDAMRAQVADLLARKTQLQDQLRGYETLDATYDALIQQKTGALLVENDTKSGQYRAHIDALSALDKHLHELKEAHQAGLSALNEVQRLGNLIGEAQSWGTWDLIGGSTLTSIMAQT